MGMAALILVNEQAICGTIHHWDSLQVGHCVRRAFGNNDHATHVHRGTVADIYIYIYIYMCGCVSNYIIAIS